MTKITQWGALLLVSILALATACTPKETTISGVLPEGIDTTAYIVVSNAKENTPLDSVKSIEGKFELTLPAVAKGEALYKVSIAGTRGEVYFVPEVGTITIDSTFTYPSGTPMNDELASLFKGYRTMSEGLEAQIAQAGEDREAVAKVYDEFVAKATSMTKEFYEKNIKSPIALVALHTYRSFDGDFLKAKELLEKSKGRYDDYAMVKELKEQIANYEATQAGKKFTDLEGVCFTKEGSEPTKLSEYVGQGQFAVVDFWASWCGPCRNEIKETLKPLYEKYKDKGLVVVGAVVWDKEEDHKKIVEEMGISWPQIFDTKSNEFTSKYAIMGIPQILLIGPDGTILARDLRGESLVKAVESNFN